MYPVLFEIGKIQIRTYSVMLLVAFIAGIFLLRHLIKRRTLIDPAIVSDLAFWVIIGVVVGARLAYVFMHWPEFAGDPSRIFKIWEGGAVYYGGFILAFVAGGIFLWVKKIPILPLLDGIAPAVALGEGIGRIGCFLNGCCFGKSTDICGITFPADSFASYTLGAGHSIWPTQLFQAGGGVLLMVILLLLLRFVRLRKGQLFGLFLLGFGGLRLGVNFLRYYENDLNLWTNNWIAIGLMVAGLGLLIFFGATQDKIPSVQWVASEREKIAERQAKKEKSKNKKSRK